MRALDTARTVRVKKFDDLYGRIPDVNIFALVWRRKTSFCLFTTPKPRKIKRENATSQDDMVIEETTAPEKIRRVNNRERKMTSTKICFFAHKE